MLSGAGPEKKTSEAGLEEAVVVMFGDEDEEGEMDVYKPPGER